MSASEKVFHIIKETFESLKRSGIISAQCQFSENTIILGSGSELDSLGFVTFISDLEERVSDFAGDDVYLVLDDIGEFNLNNPTLTVRVLAVYITGLLNEAA